MSANDFPANAVQPGSALLVGETAVFNVDGRLCATQAKCPHRGGPLNEGELLGAVVTCPYHGAQFDVTTGAVLRGPAREALQTYAVVVDGDTGHIVEAAQAA